MKDNDNIKKSIDFVEKYYAQKKIDVDIFIQGVKDDMLNIGIRVIDEDFKRQFFLWTKRLPAELQSAFQNIDRKTVVMGKIIPVSIYLKDHKKTKHILDQLLLKTKNKKSIIGVK